VGKGEIQELSVNHAFTFMGFVGGFALNSNCFFEFQQVPFLTLMVAHLSSSLSCW